MSGPLVDVVVDVVVGVVAVVVAPALALWAPRPRRPATRALLAVVDVASTVAAAVALVGVLAAVVPGDPLARALGEDAPEVARAALAARLGLVADDDVAAAAVPALLRPFATGGHLVGSVATGSLTSLRGEPVAELLRPRLWASARLGVTALVVGLLLGTGLGLLAGRAATGRVGRIVAGVAGVVAIALAAVPRVVLGPALLVVIAVRHGLLPAGGDDVDGAIILPALCLALPFSGVVARHVRVAAEEAAAMPFVRAAQARGASSWRVDVVHVLPHALLPVVALSGLQAGAILSGAVVVERVFSWPGVGTLLVERLQRGDLPVTVAVVAVAVVAVVVGNAAARALAAVVDPRLRRRP
jgi:ABC-type dipeptide/oligopeptide/nickel transport system permease component